MDQNYGYLMMILASAVLSAVGFICAVYVNPLCWTIGILCAFSCIGFICSWASRK